MKKKLFPAAVLLIAVLMCSCAGEPTTVTKTITNTQTSILEVEKPLVITSTQVLEVPITHTITNTQTVTNTATKTTTRMDTQFIYVYTTKTVTRTETRILTRTVTPKPTTTTSVDPADHRSYSLSSCMDCHDPLPDSHYYRQPNSCGGCHSIGAVTPTHKVVTPAMHESYTGSQCLGCHTNATPDNASHAASMVGMCNMCHGAGYWDD